MGNLSNVSQQLGCPHALRDSLCTPHDDDLNPCVEGWPGDVKIREVAISNAQCGGCGENEYCSLGFWGPQTGNYGWTNVIAAKCRPNPCHSAITGWKCVGSQVAKCDGNKIVYQAKCLNKWVTETDGNFIEHRAWYSYKDPRVCLPQLESTHESSPCGGDFCTGKPDGQYCYESDDRLTDRQQFVQCKNQVLTNRSKCSQDQICDSSMSLAK